MPLAEILAADSISVIKREQNNTLSRALASSKPSFQPIKETHVHSCGAHLHQDGEEALSALNSEHRLLRKVDRAAQLGVLATSLCERTLPQTLRSKLGELEVGVVAGSSRGTTSSVESNHSHFLKSQKASPLSSPTTTFGSIASTVAQVLHLSGPTFTLSATCTSGLAALLQGALLVSQKQADLVFTVGTEAPLTSFTAAQMEALGISPAHWDSEFPCSPLAKERTKENGLVLGEGAAAIALARPNSGFSPPLATLTSVHSAVEPIQSPTGISEEGEVLQRSMKGALKKAGLKTVDLIIAHAPGTASGDVAELKAISKVFGHSHPPTYSMKWLTGHTFGASGLLSLCLAIELLKGATLPKLPYPSSMNAELPLEGDKINHILINTAGFGGLATSAIVSRPSSAIEDSPKEYTS